MEADVHVLYESDFYRIVDWRCLCQSCERTKAEYTGNFNICFIRSGSFYYHTFRDTLDTYSGKILICKPDYEHTVTHVKDAWDRGTEIVFDEKFYNTLTEKYSSLCSWFFKNRDIQSILLNCNAETQFLHDILTKSFHTKAVYKLKIDELVFDIVENIFHLFANEIHIPETDLKKVHLPVVERAREYIANNFQNDISLHEIASGCFVSAFHFSRIFKSFTKFAPHQYLLLYRLKHAEFLLRTTQLPVTDVCYLSGFNYVEHFNFAFKKKYRTAPSLYKQVQVKTRFLNQ